MRRLKAGWARFWFEEVPDARRGRVFRVLFFGLLALDCFLMLPRAALHGGDFGVAQLFGLPAWTPGPAAVLALWTMASYLAWRVALGDAARWAIPTLAVVWSFIYFGSAVDGYQHHYFLCLALLVLTPLRPDVRWPLKMVLVAVSLVYAFAALAKMEAPWVDGTILLQRTPTFVRWIEAAAHAAGTTPLTTSAALSVGVIALQLFLAVAIQVPRLRGAAFVLGVGFHAIIELTGFEILRFSYYMFIIYLLVMPARWFDRLFGWWPEPPALGDRRLGGRLLAILAPAGLLLLPLPGMAAAAGVMAALGALASKVLPHLLAVAAFAVVHPLTNVARDYEATRGQLAQDLGRDAEARAAWARMLEIDPGYADGWASLGVLHLEAGDAQDALAALARARSLQASKGAVDPALLEVEARALLALGAPETSATLFAMASPRKCHVTRAFFCSGLTSMIIKQFKDQHRDW